MRWRALGPLPLGLIGFAVALAFWLPGLGEPGLWSEAELPVFDRARAALGAALSGLERSPMLPDQLRTWGLSALGGEIGLRLPHTLCASALVGFAVAWARRLGHAVAMSLAAGAVALSLPMLSLSARTALGNPAAELLSVFAVASLAFAAAPDRPRTRRVAGLLVAMLALGLGSLSSGLLLGAALPLTVVALMPGPAARVRAVFGLAAVCSVATTVALAWSQQDGFIPLLGAAKDLELLDQPQARRFAEGLEDFGYQVFPWAGLAMVGAALGGARARLPAVWLLVALSMTAGWSSVYGPTPLPIAVPTAACVVAAIDRLRDAASAGWERRLALFFAGAGALVVAHDGALVPNRLVAPTELRENEHTFPGEELDAADRLRTMGKAVFFAVVLAGLLGRRRETTGLERIAATVPPGPRDALVLGGFVVAACSSAWMHAHVLLPRTAALLSLKAPLQRLARWEADEELPATLGVHRVRDEGLALYGPDATEMLLGRRDLVQWFDTDAPAVALIREGDYPPLFQAARMGGRPMFILDASHASDRLVANRLPPGAQNLDPLTEIVLDEPPALEHETLLRFENYVEVVGWEIDGPLRRGRTHTLQLALRVLRPLPAGTKLYARMLKGRLSRIGGEPHELAKGLYPCNLWREGDVIVDRWAFETPPLEVLPGAYDLLVGLRRSENKNLTVSVPEGERGAFGVEIRGRKREFAKIGTVTVW